MEKKPKITFEKCNKGFIEKEFSLKRLINTQHLNDWLNTNGQYVTAIEKDVLVRAIGRSVYRINDWNEETLKLLFISTILNLIEYGSVYIGTFADEKLEAEFDDFILTGKADLVIAKGIHHADVPYLFLHEYKKSRADADPDGQLLAAMMVARKLNDNTDSIYGIVVTGSIWNFVLVQDNFYEISKNYNSMNLEELEEILKVLKKTQEILTQRVTQSL
jgi:uncharacterized protein with ATP-grasp and redox domains